VSEQFLMLSTKYFLGLRCVCNGPPNTDYSYSSLAVAQDSHLQTVTIPKAAYVQFASWTSWWWAECARNM